MPILPRVSSNHRATTTIEKRAIEREPDTLNAGIWARRVQVAVRLRRIAKLAIKMIFIAYLATREHATAVMYGRILRQLRESKGRLQAEVARSVGISPAHLARLESNLRGLYVEDFVRIVEALGEKPGNLLPNDIGEIGHLKPLIDRIAAMPPELLPRISRIIDSLALLIEESASLPAAPKPRKKTQLNPKRGSRGR